MKKLALTLSILLAFALGGVAQSVSFDFEDGTLQGWTTLDADGDGHCWEPSIGGMGHNSNGMVIAYSRDYATGDSLTPNELLVSPRLVLKEDWSVINFYVCALDEIYCAEHFGVAISTTVNDDPLAFTLLQEWTLTAKDAGNRQGNWYEFTVDLSDYAGQEAYVAIRHHYCYGQSAICVDDIEIYGTLQQEGLVITPDTLWFDEMYQYEKTFIINNPTSQPVTITDISADNLIVGIYYWDNSIGRLCPMEEVLPITLQANGGIELIVELYVVQPWAKRDEFINVPINIVSTAGHNVVTLMIGKEATSFGLVAYSPYIQLDYYNPERFVVVSSVWDQPITITGIEEVGTNYLEIIPDSLLPVTLQNYGDFLSGSVRVRDGIHEFFETEIRISSTYGNAYIGVDNSLGFLAPFGNEWYYEIQNENGSITYQYMYQAGDTVVQDEPTHILVKINTLYDKGIHTEVTHEYVYERDGKLYWWNKTLEEFTVLYDFSAEEGDEWEIKVGTQSLTVHVDVAQYVTYKSQTYRMLTISDPDDLFSGDIVCGIGHLTSFFPERLMDNGDDVRVEGLRCYWVEDELVFKYGDEDCDAIYEELHGMEENTENQFDVYPNPTNGILFVETRHGTSLPDQAYRISNLMGQTLLTGQITAETQQIDVAGLPQGMYFITFAGETRKFVMR